MSRQKGYQIYIIAAKNSTRTGEKKKATGADERRTDDDRVVVGDEHLAVDVDELRDQASLQLDVRAQASKGDVVHPVIVHCGWVKRQTALGKNPFSQVFITCRPCGPTFLLQLGNDGVFPPDHGPEDTTESGQTFTAIRLS